MSKNDFIVPPRKVTSFDVLVKKGEPKITIERIEGTNKSADFTEYRIEGKRNALVLVNCLLESNFCSIFARDSLKDELLVLSKPMPNGSRIAGFKSNVESLVEAEKLLPAVLRGDLQSSNEFKALKNKI